MFNFKECFKEWKQSELASIEAEIAKTASEQERRLLRKMANIIRYSGPEILRHDSKLSVEPHYLR